MKLEKIFCERIQRLWALGCCSNLHRLIFFPALSVCNDPHRGQRLNRCRTSPKRRQIKAHIIKKFIGQCSKSTEGTFDFLTCRTTGWEETSSALIIDAKREDEKHPNDSRFALWKVKPVS
jgi:hypothetical protein